VKGENEFIEESPEEKVRGGTENSLTEAKEGGEGNG
jgi:hypothetical protein